MPVLKKAKHERFAQELAKGKSADQAYKSAGFKPHRGNAARLSANESVRSRVEEIQGKAAAAVGVTIEQVVAELAKIGFSNIADFVDVSGATPTIHLADVPADKLAALSEITTETVFERAGKGAPTEVRRVKIKLWDKRAALVDLGRYLGMFKDKDASPPPPAGDRTIVILPSNGRD